MTVVLTVVGMIVFIAVFIVGPIVAIRWHRRDAQKDRARERIEQQVAEHHTEVIPAVRDAAPDQPEGRSRTPDSTASLWPPVPVPRGLPLRASAAASPRSAVGTGSRDVSPPSPAVRSPAGRRRAPSSVADVGGDPRVPPPPAWAAP